MGGCNNMVHFVKIMNLTRLSLDNTSSTSLHSFLAISVTRAFYWHKNSFQPKLRQEIFHRNTADTVVSLHQTIRAKALALALPPRPTWAMMVGPWTWVVKCSCYARQSRDLTVVPWNPQRQP